MKWRRLDPAFGRRTMANHASEEQHSRIPAPSINVTPLIDVLLVLLIIFMVIQPQKEAKFDTRIPEKPTESSRPERIDDLLVVDLKSGIGLEQIVELNSTPMSLIELGTSLKDALDQRILKTVYIKAPRERYYGDVVVVIDVMKGAGAEPIGLQVDYLL